MMHWQDREFFKGLFDELPTQEPQRKISKYIENKRILPQNSPFPGLWDNNRTFYSVEIMDNMSPYDPTQHTVVIKGAQLGITAAAENVIAYWIDEVPAPILMISADDKLLEKWATKRLEPLIDSVGVRHKIFAQHGNEKTKRTGDKTLSKEFIGGSLDMASAQAPGSLRSDSVRVLIRDEVDGAPKTLRTGEGNWLQVSEARTIAWSSRKKILDFSTPTTVDKSQIYPLFLSGDQRKFFVPCPFCKKQQTLEWIDRTNNTHARHGLMPIIKNKIITNVVYLCKYCLKPIENHHKGWMIPRGQWIPTAISKKVGLRSYHISSLYSPIGMLNWIELYDKYQKSLDDADGVRSFTNLYLGLPYKETGRRPKIEKLNEVQGTYSRGEVPYGVLFLTMSADVQRGSEKDENNPPRIEVEILGHGAGYRTWSIDYWRLEGDVEDPYSGAFEMLNQKAKETGLTFKRKDGVEFPVSIIFIDSGDGETQGAVEAFCEGWNSTFPIKGFQNLKRRKGEDQDFDERSLANYKRYRASKIGQSNQFYYQISTNYYKTLIYSRINNIKRLPVDPQNPGFMDHPKEYDENYYRMLTAEEKMSDGSFHAGDRRNEALDVKVYNLCAADVYIDSQVHMLKEKVKSTNGSKSLLDSITKKTVLEILSQRVGVEFPLGSDSAD